MEKKKILFLSANPDDPEYEKLDQLVKECNEIEDETKSAEHSREVTFVQRHDVSVGVIQRIISENNPQIVHFSGHGEKDHLLLQSTEGESEQAKLKSLANLFEALNNRARLPPEKKILCVVLSACYSTKIARAIARNVDFVVGMANAVREDTGRTFAVPFYYHLCQGESFKDAFELGKNQISLSNLPGQDIPKYETKQGIDPSAIYLFGIGNPPNGWKQMISELIKTYEDDFMLGRVSIQEFWEDENKGLGKMLLYLSNNQKTVRISDVDNNTIKMVFFNVPQKLRSCQEAALLGQAEKQNALEAEVRRLYDRAMEILTKYGGGRSNE